jgi:MoxR-like ATPase
MSRFDVIRPTRGDSPPTTPAEPVRLVHRPRAADAPFGPYVVSDSLATATNVAISLAQPLLLTGEPGCGKTSYAWDVARQLGAGEVLEFQTKSTSVARDLLYTFDTVRRFYDANAGHDDARYPERYVCYQALGEAIRSAATRVVLIDEIDKAPRDFPNDLLRELDRMEFTVDEVSPPARYRATAQHVVVITSNEERRLPLPFLRRCIYHHIPFPDAASLERIVSVHLGADSPGASFVALATRRFLELRSLPGLVKPPATGELLSWIRVLGSMGVSEEEMHALSFDQLPALQALVKQRSDLDVLRSAE